MKDIIEKPAIVVSEMEQRQLTDLAIAACENAPGVARELISEMERAHVVAASSIPSNVQMGSTVTFITDDGSEKTVTLVFPGLANISQGRISILTPVGTALIGLSEGQSITWATRDGRERSLTVIEVHSAERELATPDAAGTN